MRANEAQTLLEDNRKSYDNMAKEFSGTRERFWEELIFLSEHANPGDRVLDIGCGNGRFYPVIKERKVHYSGVDNSQGLLDEAQKKFPDTDFLLGDATALPLEDASFDIAYSFAVIHHIPGRALRRQFIQEAARVLRPGGIFIITSWYLWRPNYLSKLLHSAFKSMFFLSPLDIGDMMHTFGKDKHPRYLHAFTEHGLKRLFAKNGFEVIGSEISTRKSGSGEANILVIAKKRP